MDYSPELAAHIAQRAREADAREAAYRRSPAGLRSAWRHAALEALQSGAPFSERATRQPARRWDGRHTAFTI